MWTISKHKQLLAWLQLHWGFVYCLIVTHNVPTGFILTLSSLSISVVTWFKKKKNDNNSTSKSRHTHASWPEWKGISW